MINRQRLELCKSAANYEVELAVRRKAKQKAEEARKIEQAIDMLLLIRAINKAFQRKKRWYEF